MAHGGSDSRRITRQGAFALDRIPQQHLGFLQVTDAQFEVAGIGEDDLGIDAVAEPDRPVDGNSLLIGRERFVQVIRGGQRDRK